jgi:hypothetical protein
LVSKSRKVQATTPSRWYDISLSSNENIMDENEQAVAPEVEATPEVEVTDGETAEASEDAEVTGDGTETAPTE